MDPAAFVVAPRPGGRALSSRGSRHREPRNPGARSQTPQATAPATATANANASTQFHQLRRRASVSLSKASRAPLPGTPLGIGNKAFSGLGTAGLIAPEQRPSLCHRKRFCCTAAQGTSDVSAAAAPGPTSSASDTSAVDTSAPSLLLLGPIATSSGRETAHLMAESQDWESALRLLRGLQQQKGPEAAEAIHFNILLYLAGKAQQWELLESTFDEMVRTPEGGAARPDNYTYSTLISSSIRGERHDLAIQWIERMAASPGCVPDQVTYSTIINALGKSSQPEEALRVYRKMADSGWDIDSTTYGTVISLFVNAQQYKGAHYFYVKLRNTGEQLEEGVYNSILTAYRDQGQSTNALQVLGDMRAAGVGPTSRTHCLILQSLGKAGQQGEMLQYFRRAKVMDGRATAIMYSVVIGECRKWGDLREAVDLYRDMRAEGVQPNEAVLRHMLSVSAELGDEGGCKKARAELEALGIPMDIKGYSNVVQGLGVAGRVGAVREVVEEMKSKGIEADAYLTCIFLSLLARTVAAHGPPGAAPRYTPGVPKEESGDDSSASSVFEDLLWCLEQLNAGEVWEIVTAVVGASEGGEAESGISGLVQSFLASLDTKPRQVACNSLLDLLWAWGRLEDALAVWHTAEGLGMYPGVVPRSAVAAARVSKSFGRGHKYSKGGDTDRRLTVTYPLGELDLRLLSVGSAHVALYLWLSRLEAAAEKGQRMPETLRVSVGLGKFKRQGGKGATVGGTVRDGIAATLQRIGAGFAFGSGREVGARGKASLAASRDETLAVLTNSDWRSLFVEPGVGTSGVSSQATACEATDTVTGVAEATVAEDTSGKAATDSLAGTLEAVPAVNPRPQATSPADDREPDSSPTPATETQTEALVSVELGADNTVAAAPSGVVEGADRVDLLTADGVYWKLDGFIGWQSASGWTRRCVCGEYVESRRRKCGACGTSLPNKEAFKSGDCVDAAAVPESPAL